MGSGIRLGRVAGIDIVGDWSLLVIFALILYSLAAGVFPCWHPNLSTRVAWLTAFSAAVLFFVSLLLHELSHSLVGLLRREDVLTWLALHERAAQAGT